MSELPPDPLEGATEPSSFWPTTLFFSFTLLLAGTGSCLMAGYLRELGWIGSSTVLWILFSILFGYLAFGFSHAFFGFILRTFRLPYARMSAARQTEVASTPRKEGATPRVAIIIPIYNESVERVFAGIRAVFDSVGRSSHVEIFDFFILSDSNQAEQWIDEEAAWLRLLEETGAEGRFFYRRRAQNIAKKSGNVADFCRTWGEHYRYMIVLDADSIMTGETLVELYERMESHPRVALIQTSPSLVNGESIFGRMQQFSNRLYGPVYMEGLAFWQQEGGNFWGHNAILRLRPFMEHCDLPLLPGEKPFGGHILSHDFVEAGLLRRAGWEAWFAIDLEGSYEEGPQGIIESAQRDRRWCQGNLQHSLLLFARGLRGKSRLHLINGILSYLTSPLWLLFMILAVWRAYTVGFASLVPAETGHAKGLALLILTIILLFAPKLFCLIDLLLDLKRLRSFGGVLNASCSVIAEALLSTLIAPIMMVFHTKFVFWNLLGKTVEWASQRRGAQGTSWREAFSAHWTHTLFGIAVGVFTGLTNLSLLLWLSPALIGLCLSIPLSVWTSRTARSTRNQPPKKNRLFLTPEESTPIREIHEATNPEATTTTPLRGLAAVVLDPVLNATHRSLLDRNHVRLLEGNSVYDHPPESLPTTVIGMQLPPPQALGERLLSEGPSALEASETLSLLSDQEAVLWLHQEVWKRPPTDLHSSWQKAIEGMN